MDSPFGLLESGLRMSSGCFLRYEEYLSFMKDRYRKELAQLRRCSRVVEAFVGAQDWESRPVWWFWAFRAYVGPNSPLFWA